MLLLQDPNEVDIVKMGIHIERLTDFAFDYAMSIIDQAAHNLDQAYFYINFAATFGHVRAKSMHATVFL